MKKLLGYVVAVIAFAIASVAVRTGIEYYQDKKAVSVAEKDMQSISKIAEDKYSALPNSVAMRQAAKDKVVERITQKDGAFDKSAYAAGVFIGYYYVNTRSRVDYCSQQDVDIRAFVEEFSKVNTKELAAAKLIYARRNASIEHDLKLMSKSLRTQVTQDMETIAKTEGMTSKEVCKIIFADPEMASAIAQEMRPAKVLPKEAYQVLLSALNQ